MTVQGLSEETSDAFTAFVIDSIKSHRRDFVVTAFPVLVESLLANDADGIVSSLFDAYNAGVKATIDAVDGARPLLCDDETGESQRDEATSNSAPTDS